MRLGWRWVMAVACAAGCTKSNPISCKDGYCQDPAYPFCDVGGEIDGQPLTCIAVDCTPNEFAACRAGNEALVCNATGDNYDANHCDNGCDPLGGGCIQHACVASTDTCGDHVLERCDAQGVLHTEACPLGCVDAPSPHCGYISPKYLPDVCDTAATTASLDITTSVMLDTGSPLTCNGGTVPQPGGPDLCVLRYGSFSIAPTASLRLVGLPAAAIVVDDALDVRGTLDISGSSGNSGTGMAGYSGASTTSCGGGGGAGFVTAGARGGSATQAGGGCAAGASVSPLNRVYFAGGYHGGGDVQAPQGGGAGGGVMLVSCRGHVDVTGAILGGGGGGSGGDVQIINVAGGGGGTGGYVVLQGAAVNVTGLMFANGGSGGCGKPTGSTMGQAGPDGAEDVTTTGCVAAVGSGGAGGSRSTAPVPGGASSMDTPGGGGGSIGAFQTYTPAGVTPVLAPSMASPAFSPNLTIPTR